MTSHRRSITFSLLLVGSLTLPGIAPAAATGPDKGFGDDGLVVFSSDTVGYTPSDVLLSPAGDTWVAGLTFTDPSGTGPSLPWLARIGPDGSVISDIRNPTLDAAFNVIHDLALDSRGRLLVSGFGPDEEFGPVVARLTSNGAPDPTFGVDGVVTGMPFPEFNGSPSVIPASDAIYVVANGTDTDLDGLTAVALDDSGAIDPTRFDDGVFHYEEEGLEVFSALSWWSPSETGLRVLIQTSAGTDRLVLLDVTDTGLIELSASVTPVRDRIPVYPQASSDGSVVYGSVSYTSVDVDTRLDLHRARPSGLTDPDFVASPQLPDAGRSPLFTAPVRPDNFTLVSGLSSESIPWSIEVVVFDADGSNPVFLVGPGEGPTGVSPSAIATDSRSGALTVLMSEVGTDGRIPEFGDATIARYLTDDSGRFVDDDDSVHEVDITTLAGIGITSGCNPPDSSLYCPDDSVTRAQMASFVVRALDLPSADDSPYTDVTTSIHQNDINALAAAGITTGCTPTLYCPEDPVTRAQMASFLVRALDLPSADDSPYTDVTTSIHQNDIDALAAAGITTGCTPTLYCPEDPVTRAQMASFLVRALAQAR